VHDDPFQYGVDVGQAEHILFDVDVHADDSYGVEPPHVVHAVHTLSVVDVHAVVSYVPLPHVPLHPVHTLSAMVVHAET
jgi:hypothetical protein